MTSILGISAYYHDSAAALILDGKIIAAAQEERFSRKKHDSSYPFHSVEYVLKEARLKLSEIDYIVFYEKPFLKFERLLETYLAFAPKGFKSFSMSMPIWLREKLFQKKMLFNELKIHDKRFQDINKIYFSEHHFSHAASAFYPSPFEKAAILTLDGVGEWATTTVAYGEGRDLEISKEIHFPHSIGLLYSAFTYYTGFKVNSGEYKVMGLAPYGEPKFKNLILNKLIDLKDDGTFRLNMDYFDYATGLKMINEKFSKLFGQPARNSQKDLLTQFHMDVASSIQSVTEEIVLRLAKSIAKDHNSKNLCMAGGVALNCVANGKILKEKIFENIWIQPAAGDAGGALGAALALWHKELKKDRFSPLKDEMQGSYLGPSFRDYEIERSLTSLGATYEKFSEDNLLEITAQELSKEKIIGWFQGRMEFGPRALGNRSILANPTIPNIGEALNQQVKFRESWRPFSPCMLDSVADGIVEQQEDEYMSISSLLSNKAKEDYPALRYIDGSTRAQVVKQENNPDLYGLLKCFQKLSGHGLLINTALCRPGEALVCTPADALSMFMGTDLKFLILEDILVTKKEEPKNW